MICARSQCAGTWSGTAAVTSVTNAHTRTLDTNSATGKCRGFKLDLTHIFYQYDGTDSYACAALAQPTMTPGSTFIIRVAPMMGREVIAIANSN